MQIVKIGKIGDTQKKFKLDFFPVDSLFSKCSDPEYCNIGENCVESYIDKIGEIEGIEKLLKLDFFAVDSFIYKCYESEYCTIGQKPR